MDALQLLLQTPMLGKSAWVWLVFISLGVTFALIAGGVVVSLWKTRQQPPPMPGIA